MANTPGSANTNTQGHYYDTKQSNAAIFPTVFNGNVPGANYIEQHQNVQMVPQMVSSPYMATRASIGPIRHQAYWLPQQRLPFPSSSCVRLSNPLANNVPPFTHALPTGNVVYVRPLGSQQDSQQTSQNNTVHVKGQPVQIARPETSIGGVSPLRTEKLKSYPSYVVRSDGGSENFSEKLSSQSMPNEQNGLAMAYPMGQTISAAGRAVRNLGRGTDAACRSMKFAFSEQNGSSSSSLAQRVRMGWSPSKRKRSNEKPVTPPAVLVISSDEEDDTRVDQASVPHEGARLGFTKSQSSTPIVTETARNISEHLPQPVSQNPDSTSLKTLNYGLSLLDNPQKILDVLEEVLRERPTRLRINLKNLYHNSKIGCLSKVLSMLLEEVSPASCVHSEDDKTALHAAASRGHLDVLIVLTYKAAGDIDVTDKFKRTPLFVAVEKGQLLAAQFLQKAGASLKTKNFEGLGLLHIAAHKGNSKMLNWLLGLGLPVNDQDKGGWTSLMWAAEEGKCESLKMLIKMGALGDLRDKEMNTCLHWAAITGTVQGCEDLLGIRCDMNAVNMYGDTPLYDRAKEVIYDVVAKTYSKAQTMVHIAAREGNHDVVKLFLIRGADTSMRNKDDKLPMDVCVNNQQVRDTIRLRHAIGHVRIKRQYDCDIARGKERIAISCINEVDDEPLPLSFTYISEVVESNTVNIMKDLLTIKGCKCQDDCGKTHCECIQSNEIGRCWFSGGILDEEFLELDQPVLVECSKLCRCWSYCTNRVVQKGIQFPMEVFKTTSIGWGLRTIVAIPRGSFVLSYVGEVISDEEAERRSDDSYLFDLDMKDSTDEDKCLDARVFGNCGRFINHSCDANLVPVRVFTHHRDWRYPGIAFFTYRDVSAYEELCFDYGDKFWEIKKKHGMRCQCKSSDCKYG